MTTDFFAQQDRARKRTTLLLFYFTLAVLGTIASLYLILLLPQLADSSSREPPSWWHPRLFFAVTIGTTAVIFGASLVKIQQLKAGGKAVALSVGARQVQPNTRDLAERRLLNIVEEMAIASGVPVPAVFVMDDEPSINAFAAGYTPADAAVAVSRGALTYLTRDELQGVIAHEFSHILNGDMRLNIRLIAIIAGIMLLAQIGYVLLYSSGRSNNSRNSGGAVLLGLGLMVVGAIGAFFGNLIKAAVSRQREFLADASAVQFTRNPDGIAGALKKIGGLASHSEIKNPHAQEISHMFFAAGFQSYFGELLATHPPLPQRIRAIDKNWDGKYPTVTPVPLQAEPREAIAGSGRARSSASPVGLPPILPGQPALPQAVVLGLTGDSGESPGGSFDRHHLTLGQSILDRIPRPLAHAAHEPASAQAIIYALLLSPEPTIRRQQLQLLERQLGAPASAEVQRLASAANDLPAELRLPLAELVAPALAQLSVQQYPRFAEVVEQLIAADNQVSLFEYTLQKVVLTNLQRTLGLLPPTRYRYASLRSLIPAATVVLSKLAWQGKADESSVRAAFAAGLAQFTGQPAAPSALIPRERLSLADFDQALDTLAQAIPPLKQRLIAACAHCIVADGVVTVAQAELLRAIGAALDCPIPPIYASAATG